MPSFQAGGHEWKIPRLTVGLVQDIEDATGINIYKAAEQGGELVSVLLSPFTFAGVLWSLCEPQAKERNVSEREFSRMLTNEVVEQAGEMLVEVVVDFFPRAKAAVMMKAGLRKQMEKLDDALIARLKNSFTDSPV